MFYNDGIIGSDSRFISIFPFPNSNSDDVLFRKRAAYVAVLTVSFLFADMLLGPLLVGRRLVLL